MKQIARLGLIGVAALASAPSFARSGGSFVGMGDLPGGEFYSIAIAVSADGSVVVGRSDMGLSSIYYNESACRWTRTLGIRPLVGLIASDLRSSAQAVAGNGLVIGGYFESTEDQRAFVWDQSHGAHELSVPIQDLSYSRLSALSFDGSIAVGVAQSSVTGTEMAVRWVNGAWSPLAGLDVPGMFSSARAISSNGQIIVGTAMNDDHRYEPFRWTESGGVEWLGLLPDYQSHWMAAASADASVMVGLGYTREGSHTLPVVWTEADGSRALALLPQSTYGWANGVADDGRRIVGSNTQGAVIWLDENPPLLLTDYLTQIGVTGFESWQLWGATGISADGRTIVGYGTNPQGNTEGFIVTLPPHCPGDADRDGAVSFADISAILTHWQGFGPQGDANDDFIVDFNDITETLTNWRGECP